jgi:flagellar hook-associated protein 2
MPASGDVVGGSGLTINIGKDPTDPNKSVATTIQASDLKTNTPQGLVDAINAKGLSVRAALVTTDTGQMVQFTSTKTGLANQFSIDGLTGSAAQVAVTAKDAQISIGDDGAAGAYTVSSSSNTFTNLMPGLTITASAETTTPVTITTSTDTGTISAKVKAMVDAANDALSGISDLSSYDATNKVGGPLLSDTTTRFMSQNLLSAISNGKPGYGSFNRRRCRTRSRTAWPRRTTRRPREPRTASTVR